MFNFNYKEIDFAHKLNGHTLPSDDFKKHMHDFYELIFFVHGDVDYMIESKSKKLVSNDIILIPAGLLHYGVANIEVEYERYVLKFPLRLINDTLAKEIQDFLIHKLQRMIAKDFIDPTAEKRALKGFEKDYASIYLAHAIFGACQAWIKNGKKESPQEMTDFLLRFIPQ